MTEIVVLQNRSGLALHLHIDRPEGTEGGKTRGLALIQHGYGGCAVQPYIKAIAAAYGAHGYTAIRIDGANSINDAGGRLCDMTIEGHCNDLRDVIAWAEKQDFYVEPFALAGHSMGGYSALHAASDAKISGRVRHVLASAPFVDGEMCLNDWARADPEEAARWKADGHVMASSNTLTNRTEKSIPYAAWQEWRKASLLPRAWGLTMPVAIVSGEADPITTPAQVSGLYDMLAGKRRHTVLHGADHCYTGLQDEAAQAFGEALAWLDNLQAH